MDQAYKMRTNKKLLIILCLLSINFVYADGVFDSIVQSFAGATSTWQTTLLPWAKYLFWFLGSLEFLYQLSIKKLLPNEITKLWVWLVVRILVAVLFAQFVLDPKFYMAIVTFFTNLGARVGGTAIDPANTGILMFSPSAIFQQQWSLMWPTLSALITTGTAASVSAGGFSLSPSLGNFLFGLAGAIFICMLIMCITVMLTLIEAYFVMFAGIILCGFAGSSWTLNFWQKYLSYVGGVAIRLFCMSILMGLLSNQWANPDAWLLKIEMTAIGIISAPVTDFQNLFALMGVFMFDMVLMVTLPSKAAAMLNGAVNAGFGEAIGAAAMAMSGGKMLGAAGGGGVGGVKALTSGLLGAAPAAKSAAFKAMKSAAKNNIGGEAGAGGDDKWKQMLRSTGRDAANKAAGDSMKGGVSSGKKSFADGAKTASTHGSTFAQKAGGSNSGQAGGSSLNVDPHKHH